MEMYLAKMDASFFFLIFKTDFTLFQKQKKWASSFLFVILTWPSHFFLHLSSSLPFTTLFSDDGQLPVTTTTSWNTLVRP